MFYRKKQSMLRHTFSLIRYEIQIAFQIMIKYWRIRIRYPLTFLYFLSEPLLFLLPVIIYGQALVGGRESELLGTYTSTTDVILFLTLGSAAMALLTRIYWMSAMGIRREEWTGTLVSVYITPASRFSIILGNTFFGISLSVFAFFLQIGGIMLLYGLNINLLNIVPMIAVLTFSVISLQGMTLLISSFVLSMKQAWKFVLFLDGLMNLLAPAFFPLAVLPPLMRAFASISPITWGVEGFREGILNGFSVYLSEILVYLLILDVVWLTLGLLLFGFFERRTRFQGRIGQY